MTVETAAGAVGEDGFPVDPRHRAHGGDGWLTRDELERRMPSDLSPSAIPLTIVCGPPGSGKSTLVRQSATPRDLIIDLDGIMGAISGQPEHHTHVRWLGPALERRNALLRSLSSDRAHEKAWFILTGPQPDERALWASRLGAKLIVMDTPPAECVRRIRADPARRGHEPRMEEVVERWFAAQGSAYLPAATQRLGRRLRRPL